jgi:hypothetical protein
MIVKLGGPREITSWSSARRSPPARLIGVYFIFRGGKFGVGRLPSVKRPANVRQLTVCWPKTAEFMPVTFLQLYNGTRRKHRVQTHKTAGLEASAAQAANPATAGGGLGRWRHLFLAGTTIH